MSNTIDEIKSLLDDLENKIDSLEKRAEAYSIQPQNRVEEIFLEEVKQKLADYRNGRIKL